MLYTNVNICDETHTFKYVIGYDSDNVRDVYEPLQYVKNTVGNVNLVYIFDKNTNIVNKGNYWVSENDYVGKHRLDIPHYKSSKLILCRNVFQQRCQVRTRGEHVDQWQANCIRILSDI